MDIGCYTVKLYCTSVSVSVAKICNIWNSVSACDPDIVWQTMSAVYRSEHEALTCLSCLQGTGAASGAAKRFIPASLLHRPV